MFAGLGRRGGGRQQALCARTLALPVWTHGGVAVWPCGRMTMRPSDTRKGIDRVGPGMPLSAADKCAGGLHEACPEWQCARRQPGQPEDWQRQGVARQRRKQDQQDACHRGVRRVHGVAWRHGIGHL
eukprot:353590-Chlamydomonas_euryale.AAC.1